MVPALGARHQHRTPARVVTGRSAPVARSQFRVPPLTTGSGAGGNRRFADPSQRRECLPGSLYPRWCAVPVCLDLSAPLRGASRSPESERVSFRLRPGPLER